MCPKYALIFDKIKKNVKNLINPLMVSLTVVGLFSIISNYLLNDNEKNLNKKWNVSNIIDNNYDNKYNNKFNW